jgi:hypothetical protein
LFNRITFSQWWLETTILGYYVQIYKRTINSQCNSCSKQLTCLLVTWNVTEFLLALVACTKSNWFTHLKRCKVSKSLRSELRAIYWYLWLLQTTLTSDSWSKLRRSMWMWMSYNSDLEFYKEKYRVSAFPGISESTLNYIHYYRSPRRSGVTRTVLTLMFSMSKQFVNVWHVIIFSQWVKASGISFPYFTTVS